MKIVIFTPQTDFTSAQVNKLKNAGEVVFIDPPMEHDLAELKHVAKGATVLAVDPDNFGGFEKARARLIELMEALPDLKGLALDTTSFGWVDLDYCRKRGISVTNVPGYSRESIAEHTLALLLCLAKRILISDRKTQKGQYKLEMGFELKGKVLGVIGVGSIGSRVAELGKAIGMKVIGYNRTPKQVDGMEMKQLDHLLKEADAIAIHATHEDKNKHFIGSREINMMKDGVIIVNTADREIVDENAMATALKKGKILGYAFEAEDLEETPLAVVEGAIGIKGFGWYTKEALANLKQILVNTILSHVEGEPQNKVV